MTSLDSLFNWSCILSLIIALFIILVVTELKEEELDRNCACVVDL